MYYTARLVAQSSEEEPAPKTVAFRAARACMAKVAEFMQVNWDDRGLARFVDVSIEMQSGLDKVFHDRNSTTSAANHLVP